MVFAIRKMATLFCIQNPYVKLVLIAIIVNQTDTSRQLMKPNIFPIARTKFHMFLNINNFNIKLFIYVGYV